MKHPPKGSMESHRRHRRVRWPPTSQAANPMDGFQAREAHAPPQVLWVVPHAPHVWPRGVLFQPRAPPPGSSVFDRASGTLGFLVWFLDLVVLVLFVSDNPIF